MDETDRLIAALDMPAVRAENARRSSREYAEYLAIYRALVLAPDLATCEEILRARRPIPVSRLNPTWARAYGLIA